MAESLTCIKADIGKVAMQPISAIPTPGPGQALVRTRLSTICGSDIHIVDDIPGCRPGRRWDTRPSPRSSTPARA